MGTADLHMHSTYSDGGARIEDILAYTSAHTKLDLIAITDHDCIDGSLRARDLQHKGKYRVQVLTGAEISTRDGHLLALHIEHLIPRDLSMAETVAAVHEQGGIAIAAHPLCRWCSSAPLETLLALCCRLDTHHPSRLDGVETINASLAGLTTNPRVRTLNLGRLHRAETGGSDAHTLDAIGSAYTKFPGNTTADLLNALKNRTTQAGGGFWSLGAFARYTKLTIQQHLGWWEPGTTPVIQ